MSIYIYEKEGWANFKWDNERLFSLLGKVRNLQGKLVGKMESLGFDLRNEATLETLTLDVLKSTEIEGEILTMMQILMIFFEVRPQMRPFDFDLVRSYNNALE